MIVKDEASILTRLAHSVRGHIDFWTIVDTGSTDNTMDMVELLFGQMAGQLLEHEFDGYGPSRTAALRAAEDRTEWMLVLDADDTFHGKIDLETTADCVEAEMRQGDMRFWLPKLLRSNRGWESRGRTHEYYTSPIASRPVRTASFWIEHHGDGTGRAEKFDRDIRLLTLDWDEEPNPRSAFYLARTYDDVGDQPQAIEWYRTRLNLKGWAEETFYAQYRLGVNLLGIGAKEEGTGHLWSAWGMRPNRAEPAVALAEHYRLTQQWVLAWAAASLAQAYYDDADGGLFVDVTMAWRIPYEVSIAAWYTGHLEEGLKAMQALEGFSIQEPYASSIRSNREFYFS